MDSLDGLDTQHNKHHHKKKSKKKKENHVQQYSPEEIDPVESYKRKMGNHCSVSSSANIDKMSIKKQIKKGKKKKKENHVQKSSPEDINPAETEKKKLVNHCSVSNSVNIDKMSIRKQIKKGTKIIDSSDDQEEHDQVIKPVTYLAGHSSPVKTVVRYNDRDTVSYSKKHKVPGYSEGNSSYSSKRENLHGQNMTNKNSDAGSRKENLLNRVNPVEVQDKYDDQDILCMCPDSETGGSHSRKKKKKKKKKKECDGAVASESGLNYSNNCTLIGPTDEFVQPINTLTTMYQPETDREPEYKKKKRKKKKKKESDAGVTSESGDSHRLTIIGPTDESVEAINPLTTIYQPETDSEPEHKKKKMKKKKNKKESDGGVASDSGDSHKFTIIGPTDESVQPINPLTAMYQPETGSEPEHKKKKRKKKRKKNKHRDTENPLGSDDTSHKNPWGEDKTSPRQTVTEFPTQSSENDSFHSCVERLSHHEDASHEDRVSDEVSCSPGGQAESHHDASHEDRVSDEASCSPRGQVGHVAPASDSADDGPRGNSNSRDMADDNSQARSSDSNRATLASCKNKETDSETDHRKRTRRRRKKEQVVMQDSEDTDQTLNECSNKIQHHKTKRRKPNDDDRRLDSENTQQTTEHGDSDLTCSSSEKPSHVERDRTTLASLKRKERTPRGESTQQTAVHSISDSDLTASSSERPRREASRIDYISEEDMFCSNSEGEGEHEASTGHYDGADPGVGSSRRDVDDDIARAFSSESNRISLAALKEKGLKVNEERFSAAEDKILKDNWEAYLQKYPTKKPYELINTRVVQNRLKLRDVFKQRRSTKLFECLGNGLQRPVYNVYLRARILLKPKCPSIRDSPLTEEEKTRIFELYEDLGPKWAEIGRQAGRNPRTVAHIIQSQKNTKSIQKGAWTADEENGLREAVEKHIGSFSDLSFQNRVMPWTEIAKLVPTRNAHQCKSKWLFWMGGNKAPIKHWYHHAEEQRSIILTVYNMTPSHEKDIDWHEMHKTIPDTPSPQYLMNHFRWMYNNKVPNYRTKTFTEALEHLRDHYVKALTKRIENMKNKTVERTKKDIYAEKVLRKADRKIDKLRHLRQAREAEESSRNNSRD